MKKQNNKKTIIVYLFENDHNYRNIIPYYGLHMGEGGEG